VVLSLVLNHIYIIYFACNNNNKIISPITPKLKLMIKIMSACQFLKFKALPKMTITTFLSLLAVDVKNFIIVRIYES
jgi:hypothetical protein